MPRVATGSVFESRGAWYARLTIEDKRPAFKLNERDRAGARIRLSALSDLAARLTRAGFTAQVEPFVEKAAVCPEAQLADVLALADALCSGKSRLLPAKADKEDAAVVTFKSVADLWTSGEIAKRYPDRVQVKAKAHKDAGLLRKHILPHVGHVPLSEFTLEHADLVMREHHGEPSSRQQIGFLMMRVLGLAVDPLRLIKEQPIPRGYFRGPRSEKAKGHLYPDEERQLLACIDVPLPMRVYYGFLAREGMRPSEAEGLTWADVDLQRGAVTLDENKTDDPRAWALSRCVVSALRAWRTWREEREGKLDDDRLVFIGELADHVPTAWRAERFRMHLRTAGITRASLFEHTEARRRIRAHDLRATFITTALANGKTEMWIADRTGHRSSTMINRYRRAARTAAELGLGDLAPLDEAIPELRAIVSGNVSAMVVSAGLPESSVTSAISPSNPNGSKSAPINAEIAAIHGGYPEKTAPVIELADVWRRHADVSCLSLEATIRRHAENLARAVRVGDVDTARVAHDAIGRLLDAAPRALVGRTAGGSR